jgi:hypothetical protein
MKAERGTAEILILLSISLILFVIASQSERWQLLSQLLSDTLHARQGLLDLKNKSLSELDFIKATDTRETRCRYDTITRGRVNHRSYLCYQSALSHKPNRLIDYQDLLSSSIPCPLQNEPPTSSISFTARSRFGCQITQGELETKSAYKGDFIAQIETRFMPSSELSHLAVSGSMYFEKLVINKNVLLISLGDILINQLHSKVGEMSILTIIAPLGKVTIKQASADITIALMSKSEEIPNSLIRKPWQTPEQISTLSLLPYGFFTESLIASH